MITGSHWFALPVNNIGQRTDSRGSCQFLLKLHSAQRLYPIQNKSMCLEESQHER